MKLVGKSLLFLLLVAATSFAADPSWRQETAVMDSLREMPRWEQVRWLAKRGLPDPYLRQAAATGADDSSGLRVVGRWSLGPSTAVAVRATPDDTIVFLARGSGASIIRFRSQDSLSLELLADINSAGLTGRITVNDTLLYVGCGGVEIYSISDLSHPRLLNRWSFVAYDYFIRDTFCYTLNSDSLRIFSVADPLSPRKLGACAGSGSVLFAAGNYAYLGGQYGLQIVDVSNPAAPHQVGTISQDVLSIWVKDTICYLGTNDQGLRVYNVANPAAPASIGSLAGIQPANLYMAPTCDTVLYTPVFHAINVADPHNPRLIGQVVAPGWDYWVTVVPALNYALVADYFEGLVAVDITSPSSPAFVTQRYAADVANDVSIDQGIAYVAETRAGLRLLDVTNPAEPVLLGGVDTLSDIGRCYTAAAKDSFAFMSWYSPQWLRSVDVTDPRNPLLAGGCNPPTEYLRDMVARDSYVYAVIYSRLHVVNVAQPRHPQVVGTCDMSIASQCLFLLDSLAYVGSGPSPIINVRDPTHPSIIGSFPLRLNGIFVRDTLAYLACDYDTFYVYNVADPTRPVRVGWVDLSGGSRYGQFNISVEVVDTVAYIGGWQLKTVSVADPAHPREIGARWNPPFSTYIARLAYAAPHLYAACAEGGVCILDTLVTAVEEPPVSRLQRVITVVPSVTNGLVSVVVSPSGRLRDITIYDVQGRIVAQTKGTVGECRLDIAVHPDGIYVVRARTTEGEVTVKVIKTRR